jgi:tRNA (guanine-N7-)-methyltransferase
MSLEEKRDFFLIDQHDAEPLDLKGLFGNSNPVQLEIGGGRGEFIVGISTVNPQVNYLEIEVKGKRIKTMLRKLDREANSNVRLLRRFVDKDIRKILPVNCFERIHIYHPDPWPKRKHHKNRLIQVQFLEILHDLLIQNGEIWISTDHREYADWIVKIFNSVKGFSAVYPEGFSVEPFQEHIPTYFEIKKKKEDQRIYYMKYKKV